MPVAKRALAGDMSALGEISDRCRRLKNAALILHAARSNPALTEELRPWREQAINLADYGMLVCRLSGGEVSAADRRVLDAMRTHIDDYGQKGRNRESQTGIRLGTAVLMPVLTELDSRCQNTVP